MLPGLEQIEAVGTLPARAAPPDPVPPRSSSASSLALPRLHRILEVGGLVGTLALLVWMAVRVARVVGTASQALVIATVVMLGFLLADLASGIVHWMGDTLGDENARWFGPAFARPFREHHTDPRAIAAHGFVETNGNNSIVALPPLLAAHVWMTDEADFRFYLAAFVAALAFFGLATNQCHKWAHSQRPPRAARLLQGWRFIIPPDHHHRHHEWPHRSHYCVLSGWMNLVADRLHLFRAAENIIRRVRPSWLNDETAQRTRVV